MNNAPPISKALNAELQQHRGKWVCIEGQRLFGTGDTLVEAMGSAVSNGCDDPVCFRVAASETVRV